MKKTMKFLWVMLIFIFTLQFISAQNDKNDTEKGFNDKYHKEIGLNFTQFVTQFIPFNTQNVNDGPFGYSFKYYDKHGKAFRFGLGAHVSEDFDDLFFNFRLGYERRKHLTQKFYFTRGFDVVSVLGSFNLPNQSSSEFATIGLGPVIGLEYHIKDEIVISTESMFYIGLDLEFADSLFLEILPPTSIFVHFRF